MISMPCVYEVSKYETSDGWRFVSLEKAKAWADTRTREDSWCGRVYTVRSLESGETVYRAGEVLS